ncbi:transketolase [bacterium]|nr:transketolase [bacterium]
MLAADAVQKANSGHPGLPMGAADIAYVLWTRFLNHNPGDPGWSNRDRFVLSAGHGSMLLYAMLHLSGYDLTLDDIKRFRQLHSKTPGHPEYGVTPGAETTTGPLGQGFANGVGMALAARLAAARFNTDDFAVIDHYVYGLAGDGDLMEGVTSEAASLAGHLRLGNIIYIYDDNGITIEGGTGLAFSDDVASRFTAYGWQVLSIDGHNHEEIDRAIREGRKESGKPTLIIARTRIGYGSPGKEGSADVHGAPLGADELRRTKKNLGLPEDASFIVPDSVYEPFSDHVRSCVDGYETWQRRMSQWRAGNPDRAALWDAMHNPAVPDDLEDLLLAAIGNNGAATRVMGGEVLQKAAELFPGLVGGSADLAPSTKTVISGAGSVGPQDYSGRNIHFGVREHAMGSVMNGLALYGGFIPFGSTFFVFSDYLRPALRLSALMGLQAVYVFTHDSIFVGEDGPTHQPIEHLAVLRAIPRLSLFRPADSAETAAAWAYALRHDKGPTAICLTRQKVGTIERRKGFTLREVHRGGYTVNDTDGAPDVVVVGTGSELALAAGLAESLQREGKSVRLVSMPSLDRFHCQDQSYRESIVPGTGVPVIVIEAGIEQGWRGITRAPLLFIGMSDFGASGPSSLLAEAFGLTLPAVIERTHAWLESL